jgi:hypothetical protein
MQGLVGLVELAPAACRIGGHKDEAVQVILGVAGRPLGATRR